MGARCGWPLLVAALVALLCQPAAAQTPGYDSMDGCSSSWVQQFGVDVLVLDCQPGFATDHDRAYMFARHQVDRDADWRSVASFEDAVWVLDAGALGTASLIIDFHRDGTALVADLYDDVDRDGRVRYGLERGYPKSVESRFPTLRVTAPDGWWVRDGKVNYNLRLAVDGPVEAAFQAWVFSEIVFTDGKPDIVTDVHDPEGHGRPRWQITQSQPSVGSSWGILRTQLMVNEADDEITPSTYILWPHLGYSGEEREPPPPPLRPPLSSVRGASYGVVKNYNMAAPPIQVDWQKSAIVTIGEFVASRARANNWFTYSVLRFGRDDQIQPNFESPFAFYDLARAGDGYPDLQIRVEHHPADDIYAPIVAPYPVSQVRYSWDQEHSQRWTYKLSLFGKREPSSIVDLGSGVRLRTVPYRDLPRWVVDNTWESADLVAVERASYFTTEGIYEVCSFGLSGPYYHGLTPVSPIPAFKFDRPGLRCEHAPYLGTRPKLYFGAVDRKLHLVGAEIGTWSVSETEEIRYRAEKGGPISFWQHILQGAVVETLAHYGNRVAFADPGGVYIARGPDSAIAFVADPPSDTASWQSLRAALAAVTPTDNSPDLRARFDVFTTERVFLPGLVAWGFRPDGAGMRFLAYVPDPVPDGLPIADLRPGAYVTTVSPTGQLALRPVGDPAIAIEPPRALGDPPAELAAVRLATEVRNDGDEDLLALPVVFVGERDGGGRQLLASTGVDVPARGSVTAEAPWTPDAAGEWQVRATALGQDGFISSATTLQIVAAPPTNPGALLAAQGLRPFTGGAVSATLTLIGAIAAGLGLVLWRGSAIRQDG